MPCPTFKAVFEALRTKQANRAVIPIENTLHGSIHENYDYLLEYGFAISGETSIRISHTLIALPGVSFRQVRKVFSHPVALNQCRNFFDKYGRLEAVPFYDTAGSVKMLVHDRPEASAAVASEAAAQLYGGVILKRGIEDDRSNFTRFFLLSGTGVSGQHSGKGSKTSIVFSTSNTPGSLFKALACFALRDINLTKIESRPLRSKPWEYLFYVDLSAAKSDEKLLKGLQHLAELSTFVKVLGSYKPTP